MPACWAIPQVLRDRPLPFASEKLSDKQITWQVALRLARARVSALANAGQDTRAIQAWLGHKNIRYAVRYAELSPTGSEISGTDRQSESVAAINGPITHLLLLKGEKVQ